MTNKKDQDALHLFRGAVPLDAIRDRLGHRSVTQTQASIRRAMERNERNEARADGGRLDIERIDALYRAVYPKALKGDNRSVETCLRLQDERRRLVEGKPPAARITQAFELALTDLSTRDADAALIEAGRATAQQIDETLEFGTAYERTKALYLLPHLLNTLRELGATPMSRESLGKMVRGGSSGVSKLEALQAGVGLKVAR